MQRTKREEIACVSHYWMIGCMSCMRVFKMLSSLARALIHTIANYVVDISTYIEHVIDCSFDR
jgi:hypothetical protein